MPKVKRESRQFIVINEEKLINEVQDRPILYDKALKGYRKPTMRENAWEEVGVALGSTGNTKNQISTKTLFTLIISNKNMYAYSTQ